MRNQQHIAILRLSAMGDVAMLVPALWVLRSSYPDLKITVVSKAFHQPIFTPIAGVFFLGADLKGKHKGVLGMRTLANELKAMGVTHLADCHNVLRSKIVRSFLAFSGIERATMNKDRAAKKALCKPNNKSWKPLKSSHQRYAQVFSDLGFAVNLNAFESLPRGIMPPEVLALLKGWTGKILGVAPFAAFASKTYPKAQMREVLEEFDQANRFKVLLFGAAAEKQMLQELAGGLAHVQVVAGMLTFSQELDLISNLDGMLAMDSGNGHLAANFGVPVFTIWGVTHPYLGFAPWGQNESNSLLPDLEKYPAIPTSVYGNRYLPGYENAISSIPAHQIASLILNTL